MRFDIITIFPEIFSAKGGSASGGDSYGYFGNSIIKRAIQNKKIKIKTWNLRDFAKVALRKTQGDLPARRQVDDRPFGGGAGMVLMVEPILKAVKRVKSLVSRKNTKVVVFSAKGKQFNQKMAYDWSRKYKNFIFVTGRYEGIDERVSKILHAEEISIGPYITTDGDVATMVVISTLTRLIPNVINWTSLEDESFLRKNIQKESKTGELEYPHYTRPEILKFKNKTYRVPKILLSGNHKKINEWREKHRK